MEITNPALLQIRGLQKSFVAPDGSNHRIIDVPEFSLGACTQLALAGESGSGKTTFLNLIAGILKPEAGTIRFDDALVSEYSEPRRDRFRALNIGYIFQTFNLLQGWTCLENVLLGMSFGHGADRVFAGNLLRRVGLGDRLHHRSSQLSAGQQQRAAIARALANQPKLVLADEPTGNLDRKNAGTALALIRETCHENGAALLLVSHDREVLEQFEQTQDFHSLNRAAAAEIMA
jgi:putative ABC transport system ATP-binding protein